MVFTVHISIFLKLVSGQAVPKIMKIHYKRVNVVHKIPPTM